MSDLNIQEEPENFQTQDIPLTMEGFMGGAMNRSFNQPANSEAPVGIYGKNSVSPEKQRYVLNKATTEKFGKKDVKDIHNHYKNKISSVERRFAQTTEKDTHRITTKDEITNESQKQKVVDDFFANSTIKKANIGKILMAKMNDDMDLQKTLKGLYDKNSDWQTMSPEQVQADLFNKLKETRSEKKPEYAVLLKLIQRIEESEKEANTYAKAKRAKENELEKNILTEKRNKIFSDEPLVFTKVDQDEKPFDEQRLEQSLEKIISNPETIKAIKSITDSNKNDTLKEVIDVLTESISSRMDANQLVENFEKQSLNDLQDLASVAHNCSATNLYTNPLAKVVNDSVKYMELKEHHKTSKIANTELTRASLDEYFKTSKELPLSTLALLADQKAIENGIEFNDELKDSIRKGLEDNWKTANRGREIPSDVQREIENETDDTMRRELANFKEDAKEVKDDFKDSILRSLGVNGTEKEAQEIYDETIEVLKRNKDEIVSIYDPSKDAINANRQFLPTNFQPADGFQDEALNILKSSLYLASMKVRAEEVYTNLYENGGEKELLKNSIDKDLNALKPSEDKIVDTQNAYLFLMDVANSKLDADSVDALMESEVFEESSALNKEEMAILKDIGKNLSEHIEVQRGKDIYGALSEEEIALSLTETAHLGFANEIEKQISLDSDDTMPERFKSILGKFLNNNQVIYEFSLCMDKAKNPKTSVETTASMGGGCIDDLRGKLDANINKLQQVIDKNLQSPVGAMNVMVIFLEIMRVLQQAKDDDITALVQKMQREINEKKNYIGVADSEHQAVGRLLGIESKHKISSATVTEEGFGERVAKIAEDEYILRDIADMNQEDMVIHQNIGGKEIADEMRNHLGLNDLAKQEEYEKIYNEIQKKLEALSKESKEIKEELDGENPLSGELSPEELATLKLEKAKRLQEIGLEVKSLESEKRKVSHLINESSMDTTFNEIQEEIEELKETLEEKKTKLEEGMASGEMSTKEKSELKKEIEELDKKIAPLELEVDRLSDDIKERDQKKELNKELLKVIEKIENRQEVDIEKIGGNNSYDLAYSMHKYRELLYDRKINAELNGDKSVARDIDKQIIGIDQTIPLLQKNAMNSKDSLKKIIKNDVQKRYGVEFSKETMGKIESNGLSSENIAIMVKEAELQMGKKNGVSVVKEGKALFTDLNSYAEVKAMWSRDKDGNRHAISSAREHNDLSNFTKALERADVKNLNKLRNSNNFYTTADSIGNGKDIIEVARAENGYVLKEINRLENTPNRTDEETLKLQEISLYAERKGISNLTDGAKQKIASTDNVQMANKMAKTLEDSSIRGRGKQTTSQIKTPKASPRRTSSSKKQSTMQKR